MPEPAENPYAASRLPLWQQGVQIGSAVLLMLILLAFVIFMESRRQKQQDIEDEKQVCGPCAIKRVQSWLIRIYVQLLEKRLSVSTISSNTSSQRTVVNRNNRTAYDSSEKLDFFKEGMRSASPDSLKGADPRFSKQS
jgi:hypothetical protein